jgi:hypothetical protein
MRGLFFGFPLRSLRALRETLSASSTWTFSSIEKVATIDESCDFLVNWYFYLKRSVHNRDCQHTRAGRLSSDGVQKRRLNDHLADRMMNFVISF